MLSSEKQDFSERDKRDGWQDKQITEEKNL